MNVSVFRQEKGLVMIFKENELSDGYNFCVTISQKKDSTGEHNRDFIDQVYIHKVHNEKPEGKSIHDVTNNVWYTFHGKNTVVNGYKCVFMQHKVYALKSLIYAHVCSIQDVGETRNMTFENGTFPALLRTESNLQPKPEVKQETPEAQEANTALEAALSFGGI
jgi:hypothetical protein